MTVINEDHLLRPGMCDSIGVRTSAFVLYFRQKWRPLPMPKSESRPPTRIMRLRTRLPLAALGLLAIAQLTSPDRAWMILLTGLGLTLGIAWLWARAMRDGVDARRRSSGTWVVAGDAIIEHFELVNESFLPALWAEVADFSDAPGYQIARVVAVAGHGAFAWQSEGVCSRRGVFTLGPWELRLSDPLGLFDVRIRYPDSRSLLVYPRAMRLPEFSLPHGRASGRSAHRQRAPIQADQIAGSRPWQPGDSLRLVHWKQTAHQGEIMIKEFEQEPAGDIWLMLDLDAAVQAGEGQESTLEYGVILAASLAARYLNENRAVGLIALGKTRAVIPPQPGRDQLWRILYALAHAEASPEWPLERALRHVRPDLGRGKTLIVITPATGADWPAQLLDLRRQDIAPAGLLLDAASFRDETGDALPALQDLLADHNIPASVIARGFPFHPLAPIRRKRKVLKTLRGFGRVVEVEVEEEV